MAYTIQFQYNHKKLISLGTDKASATEAGRIVQKHVLSKTTRQRMKKFLRDRNLLWTATQPLDTANGTETDSSNYYTLSHLRSEALLREDSYNFDIVLKLLHDAGLTGNDIASILIHTPSISTIRAFGTDKSAIELDDKNTKTDEVEGDLPLETLNGTINRSFKRLLTSRLKLRKYDERKVLRTGPGLLTKSGSESAEQVISLLSGLGVSELSLARDKRILPLLLSRKPSSIFQLVAFLSSGVIGMPMYSIGPFIWKPDCTILLDIVAPVYRKDFVELANNAAIERDELLSTFSDKIQKCNGKYESVVSGTLDRLYNSKTAYERKRITKAYNVMTETAKYLRETVGISDLGKILSAYPTVLFFKVKCQIDPVVTFLVDTIGIDDDDIPLVLQSYPAFLGKKVEDLSKVVEFLRLLDVEEDSLESIFRAFPSLLTVDIEETMMPVVEFLRGIGISNIGRFITRLPPVLGYSVERELLPKWKYLKSVSQYHGFEVMRFPAYFSYPLERVIKARYEYLINVKGMPVGLIPVDDVLRYGDSDFAKKVAGDTDNGTAFIKYASERQSTRRTSKKSKQIKREKSTKKVKKTSSEI